MRLATLGILIIIHNVSTRPQLIGKKLKALVLFTSVVCPFLQRTNRMRKAQCGQVSSHHVMCSRLWRFPAYLIR